jgi:DUF971 family protein
MSETSAPAPTSLTLHSASRVLEVTFADGRSFRLPFEFLRVYSPSAEVRGHGPGQETLQVGKKDVTITELQPIGYYAVQPIFSDGHTSGIFSWDYLYELGVNQSRLWEEYLAEPNAPANAAFTPPPAGGCRSH